MPLKNQALTITYVAWDTAANAGKTGDVANHTLRGVGDGVEYTPAASPAEVDATNLPGTYKVALAAGEMNYNHVGFGGKSSTAGVVIIPQAFVTERGVLPTVAPGLQNGFGVLDANGNLPANVNRWLNVVPAAVTATGKFLQTAVQRWLTDDAAGTPAALTATGKFLQTALFRWLTDDAAGTPLALSAGLVQTLPQSGSGANSVTLTVVDGSAAPVPGQRVSIKNTAETATVAATATTNASGQVVFNLDNGTYHVLVSSTPGYLPLAAQALTVSGTTPVTYTLTAVTIGPATAPNTCRVYDYEFLADGVTPVAGRTVSAQVVYLPKSAGGGLLEASSLVTTTASDGSWHLDLPQGLTYGFTIREAEISGRPAAIPANAGPVTLRSLLGL